ncbi:MAG TPA: hypothetical protein VNY84_05860, partial [Acidimicrobiales bacterium]|nr:hypothetical protein [Acidimicrobiales bacterium]
MAIDEHSPSETPLRGPLWAPRDDDDVPAWRKSASTPASTPTPTQASPRKFLEGRVSAGRADDAAATAEAAVALDTVRQELEAERAAVAAEAHELKVARRQLDTDRASLERVRRDVERALQQHAEAVTRFERERSQFLAYEAERRVQFAEERAALDAHALRQQPPAPEPAAPEAAAPEAAAPEADA